MGGFYSMYRETNKLIRSNRNARDIFDYLCCIAAFKERSYTVKNITYQLEKGQLITSASKIAEETSWKENRKTVSYTSQEVKSALDFLKKLEIIDIEPLSVKTHGSKITIKADHYVQQQPEQTLQPQGLPATPQPENMPPQPEQQPEQQPEPALQPQGIAGTLQPEQQPEQQPAIINNKDLNNDLNKKDLKEAAKIPESQSIVNTFKNPFRYFTDRFENEFLTDRLEISQPQIKFIKRIIEKMQPELIDQLFDEALLTGEENRIGYLIKICRDKLDKNILTLDKYIQSAAQYKKTQGNRQGNKMLSTRRGLAVPDGYADNLPF